MRHGKWWCLQWCWQELWGRRLAFAGWISLGVHVDFKKRVAKGVVYGPYMDLHLGVIVLSVGVNPSYSGAYHAIAGHSRGGIIA